MIIVSDEDSTPSPDSSSLILTTNMNKVSNSAHCKVPNDSNTEQAGTNVQALKELLQKEEKKLSVLKTIHGLQGAVSSSKTTSSIQGSALNKTSGRSSGSGSGRNSPNLIRPAQPKHSIVVVPGNQAARSSSSSNISTGISSRLQQLVDNIAVDQALNSCSERLHPSSKAAGAMAKLAPVTTPPVPGLTSISSSNSSPKHIYSDKIVNIPQIRPKLITTNKSSHEIITISDSPVHKNPPPLLSSTSTRTRVGTTNGSIQVPTISSTLLPSSLSTFSSGDQKNYSIQAAENSRRYREYILKQTQAKKSFQKQVERKMVIAPYPKTFRQVWPLIPVYDSSFVRNFGLEAVMHHFDSNSKGFQDKSSSKVKPVCNQCGCDFASAWQIRKSNSKQLLLCEACDFQNLKILQRSKLGNQLKELLESIKKEEEKFSMECEEARKQIIVLEKKASESPPPLTSQLANSNSGQQMSNAVGHVNQVVLNSQVSNRVQALAGRDKTIKSSASNRKLSGSISNQQRTVVIPSILGHKSEVEQVGVKEEVGMKRKEPSGSAPPSKVYKPGSVLDLTLNRLSRQLIKRKLDEQRQECQEQEQLVVTKGEGSENKCENASREVTSPSSPASAGVIESHGQKTKSRRKGTPKHKRLLSASSVDSE